MKLHRLGKHRVMFQCPGCGYAHQVAVSGDSATWSWNASMEHPTFSPSILVTAPRHRCHSFVREGMIEFLNDCHHDLAGQTVELPEWED